MTAQRYFSLFSYPLLLVEREIWRLRELNAECPMPNAAMWRTREERQTIAYRKWRRALRIIRLLCMFPHIKMIAVCNNLAYDNATDESDIDLFIVTTSKRIWTARFFVSGFLALLRLRPTARTTRDKLCASFFVSTDHLNLADLQLIPSPGRRGVGGEVHDPYLLFWTATLYPIYDRGPSTVQQAHSGEQSRTTGSGQAVYERFWNANMWIKEYLPNAVPVIPHPWRTIRMSSPRVLSRGLFERFLGDRFERFVKRIQIRAFPPAIRDQQNKSTSVVVRDDVLKFHTNDRREEYRERF